MKRVIKEYKKTYEEDMFFKYYSNVIGLAIFIDWLFVPYFTKLMGTYINVSIITLYYLVTESSGYIIQYFENIKIIDTIKILLVLDTLQLLIYFLYFINLNMMLYFLMLIFSMQILYNEICNVSIIRYYEKSDKQFSLIQKLLLFNKSNMVLLGLCCSLIYGLITDEIKYLVYFIIILMIISIYNEIKIIYYIKRNNL